MEEFLSIQPYELYSIVMHPMKRELDKYLKKDETYNWVFLNVKKQNRSRSMDMAIEYEMGEDEMAGRSMSESMGNPYM